MDLTEFENYYIAVVDDDEPYRKFISKVIQLNIKSKVIEARNPRVLFDFIDNEKIVPNLIVLDLEMPVMDGVTALQKIRTSEEMKDIPVLVCTALTSKELFLKLVTLSISDYIIKPSTAEIIVSKIIKVLTEGSIMEDVRSN